MILAPFLSGATGIWQEQILVTIDAVSYFVLAVCAVVVAPGVDVDGGDGGNSRREGWNGLFSLPPPRGGSYYGYQNPTAS